MTGSPTRDVMARAVEAGADNLRTNHWDGFGCGTRGTGACSRCYGPSPASAQEVAEEVLEVAVPVLLAELVDRIEAAAKDYYGPEVDGMNVAADLVRSFAEEVSR